MIGAMGNPPANTWSARLGGRAEAPAAATPLPDIDRAAFAAELTALRRELVAGIGEADLAHLRRMERWGRLCTLVGYATAWIPLNLLAAWLIGLGNVARWTMVTHHVMHRGYDKVPGAPAHLSSARYARGWRRWIDWPDWMDPAAWAYEHNQLHHFHTGEVEDPDLVEHNAWLLRLAALPRPLKWLLVALLMLSWKWSYYAPNTLWALQQRELRRAAPQLPTPGRVPRLLYPGERLLLPLSRRGLAFWARCVLPYAALRFGLLPALFLPLGSWAWAAVLLHSVLAELYANAHAFVIIVPNHAGADLWRFEGPARDRAEFYLRQVTGSVNYPGGTDRRDFLMGFLNYQIEHHLWPDLPMLKYREAAPRVKAICAHHGVPYVEEGVWTRFRRLWAILMGTASMRRAPAGEPKVGVVDDLAAWPARGTEA